MSHQHDASTQNHYAMLDDELDTVARAESEQELETALKAALEMSGVECDTFENLGVMTRNKGLVLYTYDENGLKAGEFQVTIVQSWQAAV